MEKTGSASSLQKRIYLLDELRGFAVFCMVFYHGFYTLANLFQLKIGQMLFSFFLPAEPWFAGLFILIAGISSVLSHSNLLRGAKLLGVSLLVTAVTLLIVPQERILFGILHFFAVCMIGYGVLEQFVPQKKRPFSPTAVSVFAACFLVTRHIKAGIIGFGPFLWKLPDALYRTNWLAPLGFHNADFISADYFPLLPWVFVYAAGCVFGRLAAQGLFPTAFYPSRVPFFSWIGRHALVIYVLHQPIIYGVAMLVSMLMQ